MDSKDFEWLMKFIWPVLAFAFTVGGLVTYIKRELKALRARQDAMQTDIESLKSKMVRPQDLDRLTEQMIEFKNQQHEAFERFERHQSKQLELITKLIDVARQQPTQSK